MMQYMIELPLMVQMQCMIELAARATEMPASKGLGTSATEMPASKGLGTRLQRCRHHLVWCEGVDL